MQHLNLTSTEYLHPSFDDIELFLLGRLDQIEMDTMRNHLLRCTKCKRTAAHIGSQMGLMRLTLFLGCRVETVGNCYVV
jgi:hypothetical protein